MTEHNTVFISYRRTNTYMARAVYQDLRASGYDVFLDNQSIDSGDWKQVILNQIAARAHFVLILTPSALERCVNSDDMLRLEIEHAIDLKRNFVPLMFEGFSYQFAEAYLVSDKLKLLPKYNSLTIPDEYFDEAMIRLRTRFLNKPLEGVLHPTPQTDKYAVNESIQQAESVPQPTEAERKAEEYFESGFAKSQRGDFDGAIEEYTQAISINQSFAQAYNRRATAYANRGDKELAVYDLQKVIDLNPADRYINIVHSKIGSYTGNHDIALAEAEEAVRRNPDYDEAFFVRGYAKEKKKDRNGALGDYNEAIRLNPTFIAAYYNRADLLNELDDYEGAIADFSQVIRLYPESARAYNGRGDARYNQGDLNGAIADYKAAMEINPNYAPAKRNLQFALKKKL